MKTAISVLDTFRTMDVVMALALVEGAILILKIASSI